MNAERHDVTRKKVGNAGDPVPPVGRLWLLQAEPSSARAATAASLESTDLLSELDAVSVDMRAGRRDRVRGSARSRDRQMVDGAVGLWFVPVEHDGDRVRSQAEAAAVAGLFDDVVGKPWTNDRAEETALA